MGARTHGYCGVALSEQCWRIAIVKLHSRSGLYFLIIRIIIGAIKLPLTPANSEYQVTFNRYMANQFSLLTDSSLAHLY
ncbi:hypothetical protein [Mongoliitalea daihaiensis]|uniref:hypothetical protein n=1 Tax=Mongoliitalea daihaiensis TaxID=2782006 RepID=UPI001F17054B|nr:hypothetical protein [Mongoliitalea daihaiensis]UJP66764.1 hypothetical protein IPZ59_09330 [Mongoliitalea daihaiensis]